MAVFLLLQRRSLVTRWTILGIIAIVGCVAVATGVAVHARLVHPLPTWVENQAVVEAQIRVSAVSGSSSESTFARGTLVAGSTQGRSWSLDYPVTFRCNYPLQRGDTVLATVRVQPADAGTRPAAHMTCLREPTVHADTSLIGNVRARFTSNVGHRPSDQIIVGMVTGDDSLLATDIRDDMRRAGLSHLTAVSGSNMAIVAGGVFVVGLIISVSKRTLVVPALIVLSGYVILVGPEPSVLRSYAMWIGILLAVVVGGGRGKIIWQVAIIILLLIDPWLISSAGFILSCLATGGLLWWTLPITRWLTIRIPGPDRIATALADTMAVPAVATVATAPVIASFGNGVPWIALVTNIAVAPLVVVITISGAGGLFVSLVSPEFADYVLWPAQLGATWIAQVAAWGAGFPGGVLPWPESAAGMAVLALIIAFMVMVKRPWIIAVTMAVWIATSVWMFHAPDIWARSAPDSWAVIFCDVGQGDATLLRTGEAAAMIVDTGPEASSAVDCLRRHRIRRIDAVMITHNHADHTTGLHAVMDDYAPSTLITSSAQLPDAALLRSSTTQHTIVAQGDMIHVGWLSGSILHARSQQEGEDADLNNGSIVLSARVHHPESETSVLLLGDVEQEAQRLLMSTYPSAPYSAVKVAHHGSSNALATFSTWADAELAAVSCGLNNSYGHPSDITIRSWEQAGSTVVRTDHRGDIALWSNTVWTQKPASSKGSSPAHGMLGE